MQLKIGRRCLSSRSHLAFQGYRGRWDNQLVRWFLICAGGALSITTALAPLPGHAEEPFVSNTSEAYGSLSLDASTSSSDAVLATTSEPDFQPQEIPSQTVLVVPEQPVHPAQTIKQADSLLVEPAIAPYAIGLDPLGSIAQASDPAPQPVDPATQPVDPAPQPVESEPQPEPTTQPAEPVSRPTATPSWKFAVMPYFLLPFSVDVDATVAGRSASIDLDFGDILSLDRVFNIGLRVEGQKGQFGFFASGLYVFAKQSGNVGVTFPAGSLTGFGVPVEVRTRSNGSIRISQTTIDLAATYQAVNTPLGDQVASPNPYRRLIVVPYLGARINISTERLQVNTVTVDGIPVPVNPIPLDQTFRSSRTRVDPLLGVQIGLSLSQRWLLALRGDISGFNIGADRNFTWNLQLLTQYHFSPTTSLQLGYFFSESDYEDGSGLRRSRIDVSQNGLLIGVIFRF